jgi:hypothetical protein
MQLVTPVTHPELESSVAELFETVVPVVTVVPLQTPEVAAVFELELEIASKASPSC